jgi:hypothetical protein
LKEPSGSTFILAISDWCETSLMVVLMMVLVLVLNLPRFDKVGVNLNIGPINDVLVTI